MIDGPEQYTDNELVLIRLSCAIARMADMNPYTLAEMCVDESSIQAFYDLFSLRARELGVVDRMGSITEEVRDRHRILASKRLLYDDNPACSFCDSEATFCWSDGTSPIYLMCDGCRKAFGEGARICKNERLLTYGGPLDEVISWYGDGERLREWGDR